MDEDFAISLELLVQQGKLDPTIAHELFERLKNELDDLNRFVKKIARQMKLEELD